MAIEDNGDYIQYMRWDQFHFFEASVAVNSTIGIDTELAQSILWKLGELRLHFSTALISDFTLKAQISSIKDSSLNTILISQQLSNYQDYTLHYSDPLIFFSNDILKLISSTISVTNLVGIEAMGWAVRG